MPSRFGAGGTTSSFTATSQRLTNSDSTDSTTGDSPRSSRRSMPRR